MANQAGYEGISLACIFDQLNLKNSEQHTD